LAAVATEAAARVRGSERGHLLLQLQTQLGRRQLSQPALRHPTRFRAVLQLIEQASIARILDDIFRPAAERGVARQLRVLR
jgi:hypothetical protein